MKNLWAPWRIDYILGKREPYCIFCPEGGGLSDEERLILYRGKRIMVVMNKYPYNNGHLLIAPWRHVSDITELSRDELLDINLCIQHSVSILRKVMKPTGFNIGLNLGESAGAGIKEHIHFHVVPRWDGDTNFMAALADIRCIPEHLRSTYEKLRPYFQKEVSL
ncbi:HIT family protein [Thermodesulforhabdus norvegica]|uniref:Diadenosine tetraphosphate (Ap4A) hydrolase n=1 Tax=Thermodesulforhabdus norvegica TaxID=39841 RepID=A0A1I4S5C8_9BACT|nr:HIT domain-containing protein [Thermodesulforhabdus norvegica]SFM59470.1 Diadenosine tetraphosphate (Ap4A) hydrolase [Thermodesulforhabdus norvegica]